MNCACSIDEYKCTNCKEEMASPGPSKPRETFSDAERTFARAAKSADKAKQQAEIQNLARETSLANEKKRARDAEQYAKRLYSPQFLDGEKVNEIFEEEADEIDTAQILSDAIEEEEDAVKNAEIAKKDTSAGEEDEKGDGESVASSVPGAVPGGGPSKTAAPSARCDMPISKMTDADAVRCTGRHLNGMPAVPLFDANAEVLEALGRGPGGTSAVLAKPPRLRFADAGNPKPSPYDGERSAGTPPSTADIEKVCPSEYRSCVETDMCVAEMEAALVTGGIQEQDTLTEAFRSLARCFFGSSTSAASRAKLRGNK
jgi:hypothetical protein